VEYECGGGKKIRLDNTVSAVLIVIVTILNSEGEGKGCHCIKSSE
jgi:hypothetical protein